SMEHSRDYYYDISKWYLMLVGQWPYQKLKESLSFLIFVLFLDASALVTQIANFVICDSAQCIYETLPPHMLTVMILVKIFTFQFNSRKIRDLTDRLFVDWDMLETKEEHNIMRKYAQNGRWYALIYGSYVYVSTVSFTTTSLVPRVLDIVFPLNTSRPIMLAYPAYYFVDENQYFYYIFLHMLVTSSVCMTGLIAHDSMFFVYVEHICGLFAVVGKYNVIIVLAFVRSLGRKQKVILKSCLIMFCGGNICRFRFEHVSHKRSNMEKSLLDCLQDAEFARLLEDTFSIWFAVQLLIITIGLSITLVQLSMQLHDLAEAMRYFVFIIAQLFHLLCLSFEGQKLISHSLETCDKIFRGSWFTIPAKEQKLLLFVMRKSIDASVLTAGKIYTFSLENFTAGARFGVCKSAQCIYETLPPYMLGVIILVKILTYHFNSQKIKDLTDHLFVDWDMLETKEEHDIMRKYAEKGRWYSLIYGYSMYHKNIVISIYAHRKALQFAQFLENTFTISFAVQLLFVTIGLSITLVIKTRLYFLTLKLSIQLQDLAEAMRYFLFIFGQLFHLFCFSFQGQKVIDHSLETREKMMLYIVLFPKVMCFFSQIKSLVDQLCDDWKKLNSAEEYEIMKKYATNTKLMSLAYFCKDKLFAEILEDMFCIGFAAQMLITVISLSITLLQVALQHVEGTETIKYLTYVFGQICHTFCFSLQSQRLLNHSVQLHDKIYNSIWYEIPVESQRLLLYVMRRCMEPCFLSAGKIYVFSLKSFTTVKIIYELYVVTCSIEASLKNVLTLILKVVQSSMSYFTVLASFQ
ncbi:hypothetical protein ALC62_05231, partial [Cyphomyrmex costatus]